MGERVRPELLAQSHNRRAESLQRYAHIAELGEQPCFDHLPPGHRLTSGRLVAQDRVVEPAFSGVPLEPPARCARVDADEAVDITIGVDRPIENRDRHASKYDTGRR